MKRHKFPLILLSILVISALIVTAIAFPNVMAAEKEAEQKDDFIHWVEFNPPVSAMEKALKADIDSRNDTIRLNWIDLLSYLAASYWGEWDRYKSSDLDALITKLKDGQKIEDLAAGYQQFPYFREAYYAVLDGFVGEYQIGTGGYDVNGNQIMETKYGLRAYSPIAYGFSFNHYDDFGVSRSFGFKRRHLGNDLVASVGTPVVAVESGVVTQCGWNKYGGWRIGIRSFDSKRYYYYAHLRKDHPFAPGIEVGSVVNAGDPIGYVGMTGYSNKENVNGMTIPHLHFGMQLIFDESQVESDNEIWIDVYHIVDLLEKHKSPLVKQEKGKDYERKYQFMDPTTQAYEQEQSSAADEENGKPSPSS